MNLEGSRCVGVFGVASYICHACVFPNGHVAPVVRREVAQPPRAIATPLLFIRSTLVMNMRGCAGVSVSVMLYERTGM